MRKLGALVATLALAACTSEPTITTLTLNSTSVSLDAVGATFQLVASATDQNGKALQISVTWGSDNSNVATVDGTGLVAAVANGTAHVTASAGGVTQSATVTVQQAINTVSVFAGDAQTDTVGHPLPVPIEVEVADPRGVAIPGTDVSFSVTTGGGSVAVATVSTDANGHASTIWTLGTSVGAQSARAVANAAVVVNNSTVATFTATAVADAADSLIKVSGDGQSASAGSALPNPLVVRVVDQYGNAVPNHVTRFAVLTGGGSVDPDSTMTNPSGEASTTWTVGGTLGVQTAQATADNVSKGSPAGFTATALAGTMTINSGNGQTALVGYAPNFQPAVIVRDGSNNPLAGVTVTFAVASGGGSVTGAVQVTNSQGIAQVGKWRVGSSAGSNTLTATASGGIAGSPITFTATGQAAGYTIDLRPLTTLTAAQQAAFDSAKARWERLVYGDLADAIVNVPANGCGITHPAINETVDDVLILARVEAIDGAGGVLGSAGWCAIRNSNKLPALGIMRFDEADLSTLEANNQLKDVILHEMGHVLGYGTLWGPGPTGLDLLRDPSCNGSTPIAGQDTYFNGTRAQAAFDSLGGGAYTGGNTVPVENSQGSCPGTRDGHWRESVFGDELMTGFISAPGNPNPLSIMSVASLWDEGYLVNYDDADSYVQVFTAPAALPQAGRIELRNDIWLGPVFEIDANGKVTRVIRR